MASQTMVTFTGGAFLVAFAQKLGAYFNKRFGPDWKEKDKFFQEFEEELKASAQDQS